MVFFRNRAKFILILTVFFAAVTAILAFTGSNSYRKNSGLALNEVCSSNVSCYLDREGRSPDWVELRNGSDNEIDLTGFGISRGSVEREYTLPEMKIAAGEYKVVTLPFGLSEGDDVCLSDVNGIIVDNVKIPALKYDTTFSRFSDGNWRRTIPTPGWANSDKEITFPELRSPDFSVESGFYDEPFYLTISVGEGERVYYTLDGSEPDQNSFLYTEPVLIKDGSDNENIYSARKDISVAYTAPSRYVLPDYKVDKALLVKAKAFDEKGRYSETVSKSYFVGFGEKEEYKDTPVISLSFDPEDLFSDSKGIYVLGDRYREFIENDEEETYDKKGIWWWTPGNYSLRGREWERKVHVSFFDEDKILKFDSDTGARIKGGGSRGFAQKSLKLTARSAYGMDSFSGIGLGGLRKEKSIVLSSGGDDINTKLKDALIAKLVSQRDIAVLSSKPCFLFMNGEYWGIYQLSEEFGRDYIARHYGVDPENIVMIKNDTVKVGTPEDKELYDKLNSFITNTDLSKEREFDTLCEMVDMESLLDYFAVQVYIEHTNDWPGSNFALWRTREKEAGEYGDCRWRWMLFDVNSVSMEEDKYDADTMSEVIEKSYIMKALVKSDIFRERFTERIEELKNNDLSPDKAERETETLKSLLTPGMEGFYRRYYGKNKDITYFLSEAEALKEFFRYRGGYITEYVEKALGTGH